LFDEHPIAIERDIFVDAVLKQRPLGPLIDDGGSQSTQIINGSIGDIDAFNVRLVE